MISVTSYSKETEYVPLFHHEDIKRGKVGKALLH